FSRAISLLPGDATYDEARTLWNARFDKYPSMIARCASVDDVVEIVNFARMRGLSAAVRSGRHDLAGRCVMDDEISIDLTQMGKITVDPQKRSVRAEAGAIWRNVTTEVQKHGLATGGPMDSNVTVSGYGLGGGLNLLMRAHGLGCDNVLSIEMVSSGGEQIKVDKDNHPDLFWAMRGAGANFGVVTAMEYRLHPIPKVLAGNVTWALGDDSVK
ncbi:MAG: FAD-binding oxidoreductase, partial [Pseudomonadota bacterium]